MASARTEHVGDWVCDNYETSRNGGQDMLGEVEQVLRERVAKSLRTGEKMAAWMNRSIRPADIRMAIFHYMVEKGYVTVKGESGIEEVKGTILPHNIVTRVPGKKVGALNQKVADALAPLLEEFVHGNNMVLYVHDTSIKDQETNPHSFIIFADNKGIKRMFVTYPDNDVAKHFMQSANIYLME